MRKVMVFMLLLIAMMFAPLYSLEFERMFPEIGCNVTEIHRGNLTGLNNYGYYFVAPDSGLICYKVSVLTTYKPHISLPLVSAACIESETENVLCALGDQSNSDGVYKLNLVTGFQSIWPETYGINPKFIKKLPSGFYFSSGHPFNYSTDGESWDEITEIYTTYVFDIEEKYDGTLFIAAEVPRVPSDVLFMGSLGSLDSLHTGFKGINDIYIRNTPNNEEVLITVGSGSYSDGLYKVLYNDSTITGLELVAYIYEAGLITEQIDSYIVTRKNSAEMTAVPFDGSPPFQISHGLDITKINCISQQYPIYTPNFLIGTDKGVYMATGTTGIEDTAIPVSTELHQNYPNPFNPSTEISYALKTEGMVMLSVYNTKGELIRALVNEKKTAGNHTVNFKADGLNTGIYFYKLEVNGSSVGSKRMLLIK